MKQQPNRLIREKSPYLLQHALNPVDWHPWGEEAFSKAREQKIPIFLSSGYSTCHWCHVMERESFEEEETAAFLNQHFIPVKLDREEHPDIDRLYMLFVQATTGQGGWPMSVWLTPELKPFYGGSYFPPVERWGMSSFRSILEVLASMWDHDRTRLLASASSIMNQLINRTRPRSEAPGELTAAHAEHCLADLERTFNPEWGGFGGAPKFPQPPLLRFLFSHAAQTGESKAAEMALLTLRKMAEGGIHDHLGITGLGGGGFARYSTDRFWHVPHFEKMLYDNAQLAESYIEAFQITREQLFADTARDIFNYVLCDMTSPEGAFWSAEDADSPDPDGSGEKREGAFYLWTEEEINRVLDAHEAAIFKAAYGVRPEGNAPTDPHGEFTGRNILIRTATEQELIARFGIPANTVKQHLDSARLKLFTSREKRPQPGLDDKILTAWNGLMISALARGACVLGDDTLRNAAERAARFITGTLWNPVTKQLQRRYRDGEAAIEAKASDYAFLIAGLIDLYEASGNSEWLRLAVGLGERQVELFFDQQAGVFYSTASNDTSVPVRTIEENDSAEPSASSINAINYLRLAAITGRETFREIAERTMRYFSHTLDANPSAIPLILVARNIAVSPPIQIILAGNHDHQSMRKLVTTAFRRYWPELTVIHADATVKELLPEAIAIARAHESEPAAYLCSNGSCKPEITDPVELDRLLSDMN